MQKAAQARKPSAQASDVERVLHLAATDNRVQEHLRHLTKEIGPRLTGSKRFDRAAEWCRDQFKGYGLDARLEKWGEFDVAFDRGRQQGRIVAPEVQELVFQTSAWTPGTQGAVRASALLEPADQAGLDDLKGKLAGAWLVRRAERPDGKLRRAIEDACEAEGLAGYVAGARGDLLVMFGGHKVKLDKLPKQVRIQLRHDQHAALEARLAGGEAVELEFDIENTFTPGPVPCFNVVADLRGTDQPDEYVVVGGHLDSWDGAEGAQDNGTGVSTTMEAARLLAAAGVKPKRTIRFVLFGGEEEGLFGSEGYVRDHEELLAKTSVALVHDGGGTALQGIAPDYRMFPDVEAVFAPLVASHPKFPFTVRELDALQNSQDSDHAPFLTAGVPAFFWEQSEEGYEHVHHTQYDTFETVDPEQQKHSATVVAVAALGFANLDHLLDRTTLQEGKPLPRRRMGVQLDGAKVTEVTQGGKAQKAGLLADDVIVSIDGVAVKTQGEVVSALQKGGARKSFRVQRGGAEVEVVLDYTDDAAEKERAERAERKAQWLREHPRKPTK
ncbi:MAG: M20/M25/M40 family metallo-hydrolase [Planctomycetes bacterium]|nr:M20/M25/M40 family metallo-hydrolase [Planctomycetota bacterium]